jgi:drug/metabolite transporter (DMT)-like permease
MKSKTSALGLLLLIAVMWSSSGVLIKAVTWSPLALASARGLVAAMVISILLPGGFKPRNLTPTHWWVGSLYGILCVFYVFSMKLTTAANAIVLIYTAPIWVAFLAPIFLNERTKPFDFVFMGLIFAGVVLFFLDGLSPEGLIGNITALTGGFLFGLQAIFLRKMKDSSPANAMILGNLITFIIGLPAWGPPWPPLSGWLIILALGVFQLGLPYYLYTLTIPKVTSMELILVTMLEPILCPIWVSLILGERPGRFAIYGAVAVIASVTVWSVLKALDERRRTVSGVI